MICRVFFSFSCPAVRSFRGRSIRDTTACEWHAPCGLDRSTWPARRGRVGATGERNKQNSV